MPQRMPPGSSSALGHLPNLTPAAAARPAATAVPRASAAPGAVGAAWTGPVVARVVSSKDPAAE